MRQVTDENPQPPVGANEEPSLETFAGGVVAPGIAAPPSCVAARGDSPQDPDRHSAPATYFETTNAITVFRFGVAAANPSWPPYASLPLSSPQYAARRQAAKKNEAPTTRQGAEK